MIREENMLSAEGIGKNIEQAIENALFELKAPREDVDIKILSEGGLFKKARVLVTISEDAKDKYEKKTVKEQVKAQTAAVSEKKAEVENTKEVKEAQKEEKKQQKKRKNKKLNRKRKKKRTTKMKMPKRKFIRKKVSTQLNFLRDFSKLQAKMFRYKQAKMKNMSHTALLVKISEI